MVGPKVTAANVEVIEKNLRGKTKRELQLFLASIDKDGNACDSEATVEVKIMVTASELELLKRAQDILSSQGKNISAKAAILQSLEVLVNKRDPLKKAERAKRRADEKTVRAEIAVELAPAPGQQPESADLNGEYQIVSEGSYSAPGQSAKRRPVPAAVLHDVWIRDRGQCTYLSATGERCREKRMIEVDHIVPVARNGGNDMKNLQLHCRRHNQARADESFGAEWMRQKRNPEFNLALP
jgi:hypothetical protein